MHTTDRCRFLSFAEVHAPEPNHDRPVVAISWKSADKVQQHRYHELFAAQKSARKLEAEGQRSHVETFHDKLQLRHALSLFVHPSKNLFRRACTLLLMLAWTSGRPLAALSFFRPCTARYPAHQGTATHLTALLRSDLHIIRYDTLTCSRKLCHLNGPSDFRHQPVSHHVDEKALSHSNSRGVLSQNCSVSCQLKQAKQCTSKELSKAVSIA